MFIFINISPDIIFENAVVFEITLSSTDSSIFIELMVLFLKRF
jgi:hypothetical protein